MPQDTYFPDVPYLPDLADAEQTAEWLWGGQVGQDAGSLPPPPDAPPGTPPQPAAPTSPWQSSGGVAPVPGASPYPASVPGDACGSLSGLPYAACKANETVQNLFSVWKLNIGVMGIALAGVAGVAVVAEAKNGAVSKLFK